MQVLVIFCSPRGCQVRLISNKSFEKLYFDFFTLLSSNFIILIVFIKILQFRLQLQIEHFND